MARKAHNQSAACPQPIPVTSAQVDDAYSAFAATRKAACADPALLDNEYFKAIQDTAYARFLILFEAM